MALKRTEEYMVMVKATARLTTAVKNELTPLSQELVARELISVDQGVELRNGNVSALDRAANLVALVTTKVEQDRKNFYNFVEILNDNQSTYKKILEDLQPIYQSGNHIYNKGARAVVTVNEPWYHRRLSREDAEDKLGGMDINSFLVRESAREVGKLVLSIKSHDNFYHFPIERGIGSYQVEGTDEPFASVIELIDHYKQHGLESDNGELLILNSPCICGTSLVSNIPSGEDKTPKDHLYESIIDSDPTSNLATSLPGLSTIITASEPKSLSHESQGPVAPTAPRPPAAMNADYYEDDGDFNPDGDDSGGDDKDPYYIAIPKADKLMPKECIFDQLDRAGTDKLLRSKNRDGTYLIRGGSHAGANKVLSVWRIDRCRHFKLFKSSSGMFSLTHAQSFRTIPELLQYYSLQSHLPRSDFYLGDPYNPNDY